MPKVVFVERDGTEHEVAATTGQSLMEAAVEQMVPGILAECGGACACATCHVHLGPEWEGRVPAIDFMERATLKGALDTDACSRLACQIVVTDAMDGLRVGLPAHQY